MTEGGGKKRKRGKKTPVAGSGATAPAGASPATALPQDPASQPGEPPRITAAPITPTPVDAGPTTPAPLDAAPITAAPVTPASVDTAPITAAPVTPASVDTAPITAAPNERSPIAGTTTSPVTAEDSAAPTPIEKAPESAPVPVRIADSGYSMDSQAVAVPTSLSGSVAVSESAIMSETAGGFASAPVLGPTPTVPASLPPQPAPTLEPSQASELAPVLSSETKPPPARPSETQPAPASEARPPEPKPVVKPGPPSESRRSAEAEAVAALVREDVARIEPQPSLVSQLAAAHVDDGSFMLAVENSELSPLPQLPLAPILPSPAEAALEAARIVSQMVDIDTESGAVIAAAAAAGAAIEAAVAAQKVAQAEGPNGPSDPFSTVRLSRDRILRALHEDVESRGEMGTAGPRNERARTDPGLRQPGSSGLYGRARTEPGLGEGDDGGYEEFDPVAIAAGAISRLRTRARTDLAGLYIQSNRHDVIVLVAALIIIMIAGRVHNRQVTPPNQVFSERGLTFDHSASWLAPDPIPPPAPRLAREAPGTSVPTKDDALYHVELTSSVDPNAKLEILIDKKPTWSNIVTGLELDRRTRWGELYTLDDSSVESISGHDWLRTAYRYAHATEKGDVPRVDHAVEFATIDRDQIYVVTMFGTPLELSRIEEVVGSSLRVPTQTGLPLVPQTSRLSQRNYPNSVGRAFDSTIMIVVADLIDGRLKARGGGSGVIVSGDGSILTNYHVIHDKDGRLHDVFVIGRFAAADQAPRLWCAGRPSRSKLQRDLDLALIKCDTDLDGRAWNPASTGVWQTLPELRASEIKMGQRLWVLGYPDVGGGGLTLSEGEVEGWTGEGGTQGRDFLKTDASITHGNSGGPVVDDQGRLVGVASAFRTKVTATGGVVETAQVGLVRPLSAAGDLLAIASAGWTPREGHTDVELTPSAVEAAAEGVRISTIVLDVANEAPIRDALVMVLRPGVSSANIDMNRLDDQAIAWGKTNAQGEVRLKQPVPIPGNYTVMVLAPGYEPLIGEHELHLDAKTPPAFDPWGKIELRAR